MNNSESMYSSQTGMKNPLPVATGDSHYLSYSGISGWNPLTTGGIGKM